MADADPGPALAPARTSERLDMVGMENAEVRSRGRASEGFPYSAKVPACYEIVLPPYLASVC